MDKQTPISVYLSDAMSERAVTTEELAQTLGYKKPFDVERWVQGRSLPPLRMLEPISTALKSSPSELLLVWVMTQEPNLSRALSEETYRKMSPAKQTALRRRVLADPSSSLMTFDPIDEGEPGDGP